MFASDSHGAQAMEDGLIKASDGGEFGKYLRVDTMSITWSPMIDARPLTCRGLESPLSLIE